MGCCWKHMIRCLFTLVMQVVSNSIYCVPLIVCKTGARVLSAVIKCHIVQSQSHDIVMGFDRLWTCSPHIDWWSGNLLVPVPRGNHLLAGLPCNSIVHVELASLDAIFKHVARGSVAWFTFIHPVEPFDAMGACGTLAGGSLGMPRLTVGMICVLSLLMYLNCHQHHKSVKISTWSNYCQVVPH